MVDLDDISDLVDDDGVDDGVCSLLAVLSCPTCPYCTSGCVPLRMVVPSVGIVHRAKAQSDKIVR